MRVILTLTALGIAFQFAVFAQAAEKATPEQLEFFEKKIRPALAAHCYKCHSGKSKRIKGGLRLDGRALILKGGDSGAALVPGKPEKSRLIEAIHYQNVDLQMPPKGKLPKAVIADLAKWIKDGAHWPEEKAVKTAGGLDDFDLEKRKKDHWAWQPVRAYDPPQVKNTPWCKSPIDRFILAGLEAKVLKPAAPADPRVLVRRLYFDITGLPPAPEEVEAFVIESAKGNPQVAIAKVADRLLNSKHFGERWGRHWLDLVRYAESRGHEFDYTLPNAFQYRDYVIRAFNQDVPYNQFVIEHIAGDLVKKPRLHPEKNFNESILGTGFWFLGEQVHSPVDICQDKADRQDNMIDVMSKTFLGLTVACARCHDHKFDAISTKDYYALAGFLESSSYRMVRFESLEHNRRIAEQLDKLHTDNRKSVQGSLAKMFAAGAKNIGRYLLAASEAMRDRDRILQVAEKHKLDAKILAQWVDQSQQAAKDAKHPLHAWGKAAADSDGFTPLALTIRPIQSSQEKQLTAAKEARGKLDVVVDYANPGADDWAQNGFMFGPGPVRPGDLRLGKSLTFAETGAAENDLSWNRLQLAGGAQKEPGALGRLAREGRTLRTPKFELKGGRVWYLVKGNARAFASVSGHVMISGPLHGQLIINIRAGGDYRWIAHDLNKYKGRRVHIEFTPENNAPFSVAMVAQANEAPKVTSTPNRHVLDLLKAKKAHSLGTLAEGYQSLIEKTINRLETDKLAGDKNGADYAQFANWLFRNPKFFGVNEKAMNESLAMAIKAYQDERTKLTAQIRTHSQLAPAVLDGNGVDESVFIRGTYKKRGDLVPRRLLEAITGPEGIAAEHGSGRLELAKQITDPKTNPLAARVMVNRIWHHLFGRGIVSSVDNFGVLGERPSHPKLLDYLAARFVKDGWSVKKMIRSIVLSKTYQMASTPNKLGKKLDPGNRLLNHMPIRRLQGEAIRDAILAVSGRLDRRMFGPSVPVHLTKFQGGRGRPGSGPVDGNGRRSIYLAVRRNFVSSFLLAFDTPTPFSTVGRRSVSNVPSQSLILMNDPFVHQQAGVWAKRVLSKPGSHVERIVSMYESAFSRSPTQKEIAVCQAFLERQARLSETNANDVAVWSDLAHVLFNAKEFIYLR